MKINSSEVPSFYRPYLKYIGEESIAESLEHTLTLFDEITKDISEEKSLHRYEKGKWSIKDVIQHLIDSERVFVYRAMRFARNDDTDLPGFDQDEYVVAAEADHRKFDDLLEEFRLLRQTTLLFFKRLDQDVLLRKGTANAYEISVAAIGYIISGHLSHHLKIIRERYL